MNNARRKELQKLVLDRLDELEPILSDMLADLESLKDEEQEVYDNMPEGIQQSENGERCQEAADALDEANSEAEGLANAIDSIREKVEEAIG